MAVCLSRVDADVASAAAVVFVSSAVTTADRRTESGTVGGWSFPHPRFPACPPPRLPRRLPRRLRLGCSTHPSVCRPTWRRRRRRRRWAVSAAASPAAAGSGVAGVGRLPTTQAGWRPLAHKGSGWNQYCELGRPTDRRRTAARGTDSPMNAARHEPESSRVVEASRRSESGHGRVGDVLRSCNGVGVAAWWAVVGKDGAGLRETGAGRGRGVGVE